jgi:hypothetical protein
MSMEQRRASQHGAVGFCGAVSW